VSLGAPVQILVDMIWTLRPAMNLIRPSKQTMTGKQLDEMNDKFEDIEHEQFGEDGFEDAVKQISAIENSLGLADIEQFTAPPPPKA